MGEEPVGRMLREVVDGRPPPADGAVEVVAQPPGPVAGILAFAAHHVVAADVAPAWVHERLAPWDLAAPLGSAFVGALAAELGAAPDNLDLVLAAKGTGAGAPTGLHEIAGDPTHPRVARATSYRTDLRTWSAADGAAVLILGRGLAQRWEAAYEVDEPARNQGLGRWLCRAALDLVPAGEPVFLQIAPGNVPSLVAALASGPFRPIGAEILFATGASI